MYLARAGQILDMGVQPQSREKDIIRTYTLLDRIYDIFSV